MSDAERTMGVTVLVDVVVASCCTLIASTAAMQALPNVTRSPVFIKMSLINFSLLSFFALILI